MPEIGFYNQNEGRAYPFIYPQYRPGTPDDPPALDYRLIVDFGARFGPTAGLNDVTDAGIRTNASVWLHKISREGTLVSFEFRTNVWPASQYSLVFSRQIDDKPWKHEFADAITNDGLLSLDSGGCDPDYVWDGFLVTGDMSLLELADGDSITFDETDWIVEPALIEGTEFVSSVGLANFGRTHAFAPCDTPNIDIPRPLFVAAQCIQGPLVLREGFNCAIRQDDDANTITIGAARGAGAGEPCEEVPIYEDEEPPTQHVTSTLLSGGPTCADVISRINGIGGSNIRIEGGSGVTIAADPNDNNGLLVILDDQQITACLGGE